MDEYINNQRNPLLSVLLLLPLVVAIIVINMIILIKSVGTVILAIECFFFLFCNESPAFYCFPLLQFFRFLFSLFSV